MTTSFQSSTLKSLANPASVDECVGHFLLAVLTPDGLLANEAHATSLAALFIDEAGDAGELVGVANLVLVAADDPVVADFLGDVLGAVLDARVVLRGDAEGDAEFEIS